ncbi:MAG: molecular chaperone HscC [Lachnospiraceae bacterium]|nr:molecular chaperone HscC [Lachnospiraceae bacterium]
MIVGIDLGTTNSLISYYENGEAKIIPNRLGENLTPSVVSMDDEHTIYIGKTAKERQIKYGCDTVDVFKRSMGTNKEFLLKGKKYRAEEIASFILRGLKEDAEVYLNQTVEEAVISVPAYFNDQQRKATKKAGELAGLKVERIINEPTAAAISYGIRQREANTRFLVFDLGGGTFDVSILELYHNIMEVRAVAGDNYLGGEDFTKVLYDMFIKEKNLSESKLSDKTLAHIRRQAELCKLGFSKGNTSFMQCNIDGEEVEASISLEKYRIECLPLLEKIQKPIERSLKDAGIKLSQIDEVILVGGATKLPIIRKFVGKLFGKLPNVSLNPDEVVALGAAMQGAMKERNEMIKEVVLTDVCPFTLGTEVAISLDKDTKEGGHFCPIIERNTVIPVSRQETLYTAQDDQTSIRLKVLQGESRFAKNNLYLGEINVSVPKGKEGEESIEVTYTYDVNSILEVVVKVVSTGEEKKLIIQKEDCTLTREEIEKRFEELSYLKILPRDEEANKRLLFRGERLYEESFGTMRSQIDYAVTEFEKVLDSRDKAKIEEAAEKLRRFLDEIEEEPL